LFFVFWLGFGVLGIGDWVGLSYFGWLGVGVDWLMMLVFGLVWFLVCSFWFGLVLVWGVAWFVFFGFDLAWVDLVGIGLVFGLVWFLVCSFWFGLDGQQTQTS